MQQATPATHSHQLGVKWPILQLLLYVVSHVLFGSTTTVVCWVLSALSRV
jgi:hypothetical protein